MAPGVEKIGERATILLARNVKLCKDLAQKYSVGLQETAAKIATLCPWQESNLRLFYLYEFPLDNGPFPL